ncbi:putative non-specific serine/threonine protein kinase [Rosa chinensis]|uniref:Putative non-specific serine/threonine protein kinase n=1 Tax=Rosa chinensis TaxID=74649 RepID=A0A2P6QM34_ROSCH|nr:putative non-specific serine/threonine protein kinase [Rosa chinensis]
MFFMLSVSPSTTFILHHFADTYQNISLGSSLTATDDNSSWSSPSGEFSFGFQKLGNDGFILAIWPV